MEKRKTDCERSEEYAKRELVKHMHSCELCSSDNRNVCAEFSRLTQRWGRMLREVEQERHHIAGCS